MDNLENQLAKVVEKSLQLAEKTGDFVIEQAPLLLQEFYMWRTIQSCVWICFSIILYFIVINILKYLGEKEPFIYKKNEGYSFETEHDAVLKNGKYYTEYSYFAFFVLKNTTIFMCMSIFLTQVYELLFIYFAPKMYLVNYFLSN